MSVDGFGGMFRWGIVHGVGKTLWMRGGACAAELRLMRFWFCWDLSRKWEVVGCLLGKFVFVSRCLVLFCLGFFSLVIWSRSLLGEVKQVGVC
jgi:hypothetical protein